MYRQQKPTGREALLTVAMVMPLFVGLYIMMVTPLVWVWAIASVMLVLAAVAFVALWRAKPADRLSKRQNFLYGYFILLPIIVVAGLGIALAKVHWLQQFGLDAQATIILILYVGIIAACLILAPLIILLRRKQRRGLQLTDEEQAIEEEFKQAIRHMPVGWGMRPEEATKQGLLISGAGIILGGGAAAAAGAFAVHFAVSGLGQAQNILYFATSLLFCVIGIYLLFFGPAQGLKLWRAGRRWREQVTGTVTIHGMFADEWLEQKVNGKTLLRIQQKMGSSKMLLVGAEFEEVMPEVGEDVEIDYLFGCEAVVGVRSLAGAAPAAEKDQATEEV